MPRGLDEGEHRDHGRVQVLSVLFTILFYAQTAQTSALKRKKRARRPPSDRDRRCQIRGNVENSGMVPQSSTVSRRHVAGWATRLACLIAGWGFTPAQAQQPGNDPALAVALEQIRAKYDMPALAGAVFNCDGIVAEAAVGVRKRGTDTPVTLEDQWHFWKATATKAEPMGPITS